MPTITSNGPRKAAKVLACQTCQQRKKKCDHNSPCSTCMKYNIKCVPSKPAPPRSRRQPTKELLERMARCELLLQQCLEQRVLENKQPQPPPWHDARSAGGPGSTSTAESMSSPEEEVIYESIET